MRLKYWFRGFLSAWWLAACLVCAGNENTPKAWFYGLISIGITVYTALESQPSPTTADRQG